MLAWLLFSAIYLLGCVLMVDNIRAQPHGEHPYRGYGFVLLGIIVMWPLAVVYGALVVLWDRT